MAFDGITLHFLKNELQSNLIGARVEKINQPSKLELVFSMRTRNGAYKLLMSSEPNSARIHLTEHAPENPQKPPMLCMLFRKKLTGAVLREIRQSDLDRILFLDFEAANEIGDAVRYTLAIEIMAQHSNIILISESGKIIDAIKRVDETKSSFREVLPTVTYHLPPQQSKLNIAKVSAQEICDAVFAQANIPVSKALLNIMQGASPLLCRELVGRAYEEERLTCAAIPEKLLAVLEDFKACVCTSRIHPTVLRDQESKPFEFACIPIFQYGTLLSKTTYETVSQMLDSFFYERDRTARMHSRAKDLYKILSNASERVSKKINLRRLELEKCADKENLRVFAELINANQYKLSAGAAFYDLENYYENNKLIRIPVNPALPPAKNAQRYYKEYKKAHTAEKMLSDLIIKGEQELAYLASVTDCLSRAESERELSEIRDELTRTEYLKKRTASSKLKPPKALPPLVYVTTEGFTVLVGRNNMQNDVLTFKTANNHDLWLHVQGMPGSHTILLSDHREISELAVSEAAIIAACNSAADENTKVPVDYTAVKNIKKPSGGLPGKVIYHAYNTIYVVADKSKITEKKPG